MVFYNYRAHVLSSPGARVMNSFFVEFLKTVASGVGFSTLGVLFSHFLCARKLGNLPFQKNSPGACMVGGGGGGGGGREMLRLGIG